MQCLVSKAVLLAETSTGALQVGQVAALAAVPFGPPGGPVQPKTAYQLLYVDPSASTCVAYLLGVEEGAALQGASAFSWTPAQGLAVAVAVAGVWLCAWSWRSVYRAAN